MRLQNTPQDVSCLLWVRMPVLPELRPPPPTPTTCPFPLIHMPQDVSHLLWAHARSGRRPSGYWLHTMCCRAHEVMGGFRPQVRVWVSMPRASVP